VHGGNADRTWVGDVVLGARELVNPEPGALKRLGIGGLVIATTAGDTDHGRWRVGSDLGDPFRDGGDLIAERGTALFDRHRPLHHTHIALMGIRLAIEVFDFHAFQLGGGPLARLFRRSVVEAEASTAERQENGRSESFSNSPFFMYGKYFLKV